MSKLRILVVENQANWQEELPRILQRLGDGTEVVVAPTYGDAVSQMERSSFDLAIVDLALTDAPGDQGMRDEQGMLLIEKLRHSPANHGCGVIVLTGYPSSEYTKRAIKDFSAHEFLQKDQFTAAALLKAARGALLDARLRRAELRLHERYKLTVSFSHERLVGTQLSGPDRREVYRANDQQRFDAADLARRADSLNFFVLKGDAEVWRREARSIGAALVENIARDRRIYGDLVAAKALAERFSDLAVEFCGPAVGVGIPFELMYEGDDYLAFNHVVSHCVDASTAPTMTRKPESFVVFVQRMVRNHEPIRILLVASNSNGKIPAVDTEVKLVAKTLTTSFQQLDITPPVIRCLEDASYEQVVEELRTGQYHIFHYAGHGRFDDTMPEIGGLVLRHSVGIRTLSASDLNLLLRDSGLRFVYLSACVGARSAEQTGRGDFHGVLDALVRADIPYVVGYRWTVGDCAALRFAETVYGELMRTFSPGDALLAARRQAAMEVNGRDEASWASAVLLAQND